MKKRNFRLYIGLIFFLGISSVVGGILHDQSRQILWNKSFNPYHTADIQEEDILVDTVYTIQAPYDTILIDSLYLSQYIEYNITVSLITPHSCRMNISVQDPSACRYNIMSKELSSDQEGYAIVSITFGTALFGEYEILFLIEAEYNLNIYIKIFANKGCFEEIIMEYGNENLLFYRVTKFSSPFSHIEHSVWLNPNISYHFFLGRLTPLTSIIEKIIYLNYSIEAPDGIEFSIYANLTLLTMPQLYFFSFQTAHSGVHTIKLELFTEIILNIGYIVLIQNQSSANTSESQNPFLNAPNGTFFIPLDFLFYLTITIILILTGISYIFKVLKRKTNSKVLY